MDTRTLTVIFVLALFYSLEGLFPFFEGRKNRLKHALSNAAVGGLNVVITSLVFSGITVMLMLRIEDHAFGLMHLISAPAYLEGIAVFLIFDCWMYLWHRINHRIPFLWRFHRMHHSDIEMDNTSALRFHPGEIIFSSIARLIVIPVIGMNVHQLLIYETVLFIEIVFHHSNVALPARIDKALCSLIVTPNMHRVHHSQIRVECDSNYSSVFSFWDRVFRTFRVIDQPRSIHFGVRNMMDKKWQTLTGMIMTPFRNPDKKNNP